MQYFHIFDLQSKENIHDSFYFKMMKKKANIVKAVYQMVSR